MVGHAAADVRAVIEEAPAEPEAVRGRAEHAHQRRAFAHAAAGKAMKPRVQPQPITQQRTRSLQPDAQPADQPQLRRRHRHRVLRFLYTVGLRAA